MTPDPFRDAESTRAAIAEALDAIAKMERDARERKTRDMTEAQYRRALARNGITLAPFGPSVTLPDGREVDGSTYGATRRERVAALIREAKRDAASLRCMLARLRERVGTP